MVKGQRDATYENGWLAGSRPGGQWPWEGGVFRVDVLRT